MTAKLALWQAINCMFSRVKNDFPSIIYLMNPSFMLPHIIKSVKAKSTDVTLDAVRVLLRWTGTLASIRVQLKGSQNISELCNGYFMTPNVLRFLCK